VAFSRFLFEQKLYYFLSCCGQHSGTVPAAEQWVSLMIYDLAAEAGGGFLAIKTNLYGQYAFPGTK
jgi:hypothetical protein